MAIYFGLVFLALFGFSFEQKSTNYCNIKSCGTKKHFMCNTPAPEITKKCPAKLFDISNADQRIILSSFVDLKQELAKERAAKGKANVAKVPKGLEWDGELATIAQKIATQCDINTDFCYDTSKSRVSASTDPLNFVNGKPDWKTVINHLYKDETDIALKASHGMKKEDIPLHYTYSFEAEKVGCGAHMNQNGKDGLMSCVFSPSMNRWIDSMVKTSLPQ